MNTDTAHGATELLDPLDNTVRTAEAGALKVVRFRGNDYPFPINGISAGLAAKRLAADPEAALPPASSPSEVNAYGVAPDAWVEVTA